ncbi:aminopeptidase P family protein [Reichenbachiella agarivorans]|uniref:Xaa-Pro aminopeptidase n=1 Tax=Reichenbachiella agarivorans TaxID=2979464 RepID=A0ABY6CVQ6_9BACT|nr:aminopeptidase P family protein [Reichenbachiella agarivorans]UXP33478.1 aminopeptidase P family protein [Reichenbachiella agarivorans]
MKQLALIPLIFFALVSLAQPSDKSSDYLQSEFHAARREALRAKLPANSVAVFFSNPVRNRSNDVSYVYHQDPEFYYLTGHKEPHSVLLVFKEDQKVKGKKFNEIIFVREHDALMELYEGARIGPEGAKEKLNIAMAFEGSSFGSFNLDFSKFDKVLFYDFQNDVRDTDEEGDLFDLISQFKEKIGYNQTDLNIEPQANNLDVSLLDLYMTELREIKTEEELDLLKKAINISAIGQVEVMKAMKPGMSETEVQGMHEFIFKKYRAEYEGYPSIVGAGHNGCVLHYIDNYKPAIEDGELILMDLGAEYHGYTADVTRTIPVNGKFTKEQKLVYDIVYEAQQAAADTCKAGLPFYTLYDATAEVVNEGLVELGLYKSTDKKDIVNPETGRNRYYPHGCCHHIGLDVHDKGIYDKLEENMVITIEPGIYIPEGSPSDQKWWNIPVRIEDDYLVTKDGCVLLSNLAPRTSEEIEKTMAQPSVFSDYTLPSLD